MQIGEDCDVGFSDQCGPGATCQPPAKGGYAGVCGCDTNYGNEGSDCSEITASGWTFAVGTIAVLALGTYVVNLHAQLAMQMRALEMLKPNDLGQTFAFNLLSTILTIAASALLFLKVHPWVFLGDTHTVPAHKLTN